MDKSTATFITNQNEILKNDIEKLMAAQATVISARVDLKIEQKMGGLGQKIDSICAHNEKQNGWIKEHAEKIEKNAKTLEKELWFFRLIGRNPKVSAVAFLTVIMLGAYGYHKINIKKTVERVIPVVVLEEETE